MMNPHSRSSMHHQHPWTGKFPSPSRRVPNQTNPTNHSAINPQLSGSKVTLITTSEIDKATNTDHLVILEPPDIDKLANGFKLISFNQIPPINLSTANSIITQAQPPKSEFKHRYVPDPNLKSKEIRKENYQN